MDFLLLDLTLATTAISSGRMKSGGWEDKTQKSNDPVNEGGGEDPRLFPPLACTHTHTHTHTHTCRRTKNVFCCFGEVKSVVGRKKYQ